MKKDRVYKHKRQKRDVEGGVPFMEQQTLRSAC
jgi:hypothetical protein